MKKSPINQATDRKNSYLLLAGTLLTSCATFSTVHAEQANSCYLYQSESLSDFHEEESEFLDFYNDKLIFERDFEVNKVTLPPIEDSNSNAAKERVAVCECIINDEDDGICSNSNEINYKVKSTANEYNKQTQEFRLNNLHLANDYRISLDQHQSELQQITDFNVNLKLKNDLYHSVDCKDVVSTYRQSNASNDITNGVISYQCTENSVNGISFTGGSTSSQAPGAKNDPIPGSQGYYRSDCSINENLAVDGVHGFGEYRNVVGNKVIRTERVKTQTCYRTTTTTGRGITESANESTKCWDNGTTPKAININNVSLSATSPNSNQITKYSGPAVKSDNYSSLTLDDNWSNFNGSISIISDDFVSKDHNHRTINFTRPDGYKCKSRVIGGGGEPREYVSCETFTREAGQILTISMSGESEFPVDRSTYNYDCRYHSSVTLNPTSYDVSGNDDTVLNITYEHNTNRKLQVRSKDKSEKLIPIMVGDITTFVPADVYDPYTTVSNNSINSGHITVQKSKQAAKISLMCNSNVITSMTLDRTNPSKSFNFDSENVIQDIRNCKSQLHIKLSDTKLSNPNNNELILDANFNTSLSDIQSFVNYANTLVKDLTQAQLNYELFRNLATESENNIEGVLINTINDLSINIIHSHITKGITKLKEYDCAEEHASNPSAFTDPNIFNCDIDKLNVFFTSFYTKDGEKAMLDSTNEATIFLPGKFTNEEDKHQYLSQADIAIYDKLIEISAPPSFEDDSSDDFDSWDDFGFAGSNNSSVTNNDSNNTQRYWSNELDAVIESINKNYGYLQKPLKLGNVEQKFDEANAILELNIARAKYFLDVLVEAARFKSDEFVSKLNKTIDELTKKAEETLESK